MMEKPKLNLFRFFLSASTVFLFACAQAKSTPTVIEQTGMQIKFDKESVIEGRAFQIDVISNAKFDELNGELIGRKFKFTKNPGSNTYSALVGIEYGAELKDAKLIIGSQEIPIEVKPGTFPSEKLSVPPKTIAPSKKDLAQIAKDNAFLKIAYANTVDEKLWDAPIVLPVEDRGITSVYGSHRVYNGKHISPHLGTDFRAPTGTLIHSPLAGRVVCARPLFYTGNTVILDHGFGFFTVYGHMSKLNVKEGISVKKTDVLGLSGMTGRASGPHLHWGVKLHGAKIDPMSIVSILK